MEFRILGPVEVFEDGLEIALGGGKQRALLSVLLLHAGETVSIDRLIDALWGDHPPASAANSVHVYVSQLRKAVGDGQLETRGHGYALAIEPEAIDARRFERLVGDGRRLREGGDPAAAAETLESALGLWHGPAFADLSYEAFAHDETARLEELRIIALEERLEAELELGRSAELVPELEALVRSYPLRERLRAQLMLALYRSGRQAEALDAYRDGRRLLAEELGLDPSPELRQLERAILKQDPALDGPVPLRPSRGALGRRGPLVVAAAAAALLLVVGAAVFQETRSRGAAGLESVGPNAVGVIDPKTNRIVAQVPVGTRPLSVAVDENAVWVANAEDGTVSRIDARARRVVKTIGIGAPATDLALTKGAVWVGNGSDGTLSRIDPRFDAVVSTLDLRASDSLFPKAAYAVASGGGSVWVASGDRRVLRVDSDTGTVVARIPLQATPFAIAYGNGAVWAATDAGEVLRIEPRTNGVTGRLGVGFPLAAATGDNAVWIAINPARGRGAVWQLDPQAMTLVQTIPIRDPVAIAVGAGSVWVASASDGTVYRIDPRSNAVVASITVGHAPAGIAVGNEAVWVAVDETR